MRWHDLLAGLDGSAGRRSRAHRGPGRRDRRRSPTTAGGSRPAPASPASRARRPTATSIAPEAVARGAVALLVERVLPARRRPGAGPDVPRPRSARWRRGSTATRRRRCGASASPAPTGKTTTTYLLDAIARAARATASASSAPSARASTARRRGRDVDAHDARGDRAPGPAGADARRGRGHGRDGGVVARARPAPGRRHAVRRRVLHQPEPRAPRRPRHARGVLRGEGAPVRRREFARAAAVNLDDPLRREHRATGRRDAGLDVWTYAHRRRSADLLAVDVELGGDGTRSRSSTGAPAHGRRVPPPARRPLQRRQRARRGRDRSRRGIPCDAVRSGLGEPARRARPDRAGRRRPAVHGARRLRPHARRARPGARRRPRARRAPGPGRGASSAAAATATRRSGR